tara:strand:- start:45973 stop:47268 length:1296 start_codon:yes stop_codon:yes gene_type:complete
MSKGKFILSVLMLMACITLQRQAHAQAESTLTLDGVYRAVLDQNPQIQGYKAKIVAAEGHRAQVSLRPNPQAIFEAENFGGDTPRSGLDAAEYSLGVQQQLEIAGKRSKREQVAMLEKQHMDQQALASIQSVLAQTKSAYMQVAIAQETLRLAKQRVALADQTHQAVKKRINAAKSAEIQHTKADLEVSSARVAERKAEKELRVTKMALANLMGRADLGQNIAADLMALPAVPQREVILQAIEQTPMSVMSQIAVMREDAALGLARANGVADPVFGLGVRRFAEGDGTAFLASISIPINVFDRNQGRIAEAKANLRAAQADQTAQRLALERQVMEVWQTLVSVREEVTAYQDGLLPSARKAYSQAEDGFNRGAFSFLDLLDAQRTLFDMQERHLEALAAFHSSTAQIDMLSGAYADMAASALGGNLNKKEE